METRALGNSGVTVPVVGMGTWSTFDFYGSVDVYQIHNLVNWRDGGQEIRSRGGNRRIADAAMPPELLDSWTPDLL